MGGEEPTNWPSRERPHDRLAVYRTSHELALLVHRLSLQLPSRENFEEASQVRRSSKSISSQIVEGHALRRYKQDYVRYIARSYASCEETVEHISYLVETGSAGRAREEWGALLARYDDLSRRLFNYCQAVRAQHDAQRRPRDGANGSAAQ